MHSIGKCILMYRVYKNFGVCGIIPLFLQACRMCILCRDAVIIYYRLFVIYILFCVDNSIMKCG